MPCLIKPDMHHTWLCIMPWLCLCVYHGCLLLSGLLLLLASVSFRSCEDSFDYVRLSSSWTRSSSLWDFRQDDHTLDITTIFAMLVCSLFAMPMLRRLPFACQPPKLPCQTSNPPCPSKPLIGYVTALLSPLIALLVAGEDWSLFLVGTWRSFLVGTLLTCWDITISLI